MLSACQTPRTGSSSGRPEMSERARSRRSPRIRTTNSSASTRGRRTRRARMPANWSGSNPSGVKATNDVDALLALKPDVVVYNPMWIDVDELVRILEAGVNVVASASFITGHNLGDGRDRLEDACKRGGSTLFGSGVSPGFAELLAIVATTGLRPRRQGHHRRVRRHHPLRLAGHRASRGLRHGHRRPGAAADGRERHRGVRRGRAARGRLARRRARRDQVCVRIRPDHRGSRDGLVDHQGRPRGGGLRQLAGPSAGGKTVIDINVRWKKGTDAASPTGSSTATAGRSPSKGGRRSTCLSASCRRRT